MRFAKQTSKGKGRTLICSPQQSSSNSLSNFSESLPLNEELVQVEITIYSLNGVLCCPKQKKRTKKRIDDENEKGREKIKLKNLAPTTAVVSLQRDTSNSGFALHTFLPSLPLKTQQLENQGGVTRFGAFWWDAYDNATKNVNNRREPLRFELTRLMRRTPYNRGTSAVHASPFIHEKIDLNVSLGRGTELISLGTATIAITGEEEHEMIVNVPVKSHRKEIETAVKFRSKRTRKESFVSNKNHFYMLDDNATLRLGLKVFVKAEAQGSPEGPGHLPKTASGTIFSSDKTIVLELDDENSFIDSTLFRSYSQATSRTTNGSRWSKLKGFSCCVSDLCGHAQNDELPKTLQTVQSLSDMSDSGSTESLETRD